MIQLGASRSVSPVREWMRRRFLVARRVGRESWYLSGKRGEGRVRWVWRAQWGWGGAKGEGKLRRRVGCSPVGWRKEAR